MHASSYDLSPGSGMMFHLFLLPETDTEQKIYEKQQVGILLLNIPWQGSTVMWQMVTKFIMLITLLVW